MEITYRELYNIIRENSFDKYEELSCHVSSVHNVEITDKKPIQRYFYSFKQRWKASMRTAAKFEKRNESWLNTRMILETAETCTRTSNELPTTSNEGRSNKTFDNSVVQHNENLSTNVMNQALCQRYKSEEQYEKASIVEAIDKADPDLLTKIKDSIRTSKDESQTFTAEEALSLFLDLGLSKDKYIVLRNELKKRKHNALPSYDKIIQAIKDKT